MTCLQVLYIRGSWSRPVDGGTEVAAASLQQRLVVQTEVAARLAPLCHTVSCASLHDKEPMSYKSASISIKTAHIMDVTCSGISESRSHIRDAAVPYSAPNCTHQNLHLEHITFSTYTLYTHCQCNILSVNYYTWPS